MPDLEPLGQGEGSDWTAAVPEGGVLAAPTLPHAGDRSAIELLREAGKLLPESGGDGGVGGEPIVAPPAPDEGPERGPQSEKNLSLVGLKEAKDVVDKAIESTPELKRPAMRVGEVVRLESLTRGLKNYLDKMGPVTEVAVAERAERRRGGLTESQIGERQLGIEDLRAEVACKEALIDELNIPGKEERAGELGDDYYKAEEQAVAASIRAARVEKRAERVRDAFVMKESKTRAQVASGELDNEDAELILTKRKQAVTVSELESAEARKLEADANLRAKEAKLEAEAAYRGLEEDRLMETKIKTSIRGREDGIKLAVADIVTAGEVSDRTREQLERARAKCEELHGEAVQRLGVNEVARNLQELQEFMERLEPYSEEGALPLGLRGEMARLEKEFQYLFNRDTIGQQEYDAAFDSQMQARRRHYRKLHGDNWESQIRGEYDAEMDDVRLLIAMEERTLGLDEAPYRIPEILRQGVRDVKEGRGFIETDSDDPEVRRLNKVQRAAAAKVLESLGLEVPLTAEEQERQRQEIERFGDLRAMLESDQEPEGDEQLKKRWRMWKARQAIQEEIKNAKAGVAEAQKKVDELTAQLAEERKAGGEKVADLEGQLKTAKDTAAQREAGLLKQAEAERQRAEALAPWAREVKVQIDSALESAVRDLGSAVIPDGLKAPLVAGETLAYRLAAIEGWRQDELEKQLQENKRQLGVNPETDKAGDGREHEKSVKRVDDILTKFQAGEANDKTIQSTLNELRQVPGIGPAMAEVFSKMVSRLQANRGSLSDNDITEAIGKDGNLRKLLGAKNQLGVSEFAGIGAGAVAGMLPLFEGMFNTALASMGLAGR